jgi:hypothetical protein
MSRLALSDEDAQVRRWFHQETERLGCKVTIDQMGNMFARRPGALRSCAPMTAMGSHLDTQPRGGRYDGILGVVAAVEVLRTMEENGYQTQYDVGIVNWTKFVTLASFSSHVAPCCTSFTFVVFADCGTLVTDV